MSFVALLLAWIAAASGSLEGSAGSADAAPPGVVTAVAVGDIASCGSDTDQRTANLVDALRPDAVLTLGDNAYPSGSPEDFAHCYAPTWGPFLDGTHPSPGNHDYATPGASGYFAYFGGRARGPYYSFDLGAWHAVSLNSEIEHGFGSAQVRWLRRDLARDRRTCEVLYWHRPRWSGGKHGSDPGMQALWRAAWDHGVDLVLVGHDHNYQRFRALGPRGRIDRRFGIRQVVVGTGGGEGGLYDAGAIANRAAANWTSHGVLALTLRRGSYDLRFVPAAGSSFADALRGVRCHGAPPRR